MSHSSSLALVLLCVYHISFLVAQNSGFSVEMIHRDSSQSPFYRHTETQLQRVANAVRRSINRANNLNLGATHPNTVMAKVTKNYGEYLMSYSVGTPPFQLFGIIDTGSDIIWLQCKPCQPCYHQTTPIFDPSKSNTYTTIPCSSTACPLVQDASCSSNKGKNCEYTIKYGDGSHSRGDLSVETLTIGSTNGSFVHFPKTRIGCGHSNIVSFEGETSGIVGLGEGPLSLISQLGSSIGGKFSYCFAPVSNISSKLNFGDAAVVSGRGTVSTPIFHHVQQPYYYLNLEEFFVGNHRIEYKSSTPSVKGNIIIDSGTSFTFLPADVYSKLESAVANVVKLERVQGPFKELSLCYKSRFDQLHVHVPMIIAHFSGAYVYLNAVDTFIDAGNGVVCFAFLSTKSIPIFGNVAQQNILVGYDLQKKLVSFKLTDCTKQ
ncbi:Aspartic proteinase CDR1, partial [Mucuna pruriens]